MQHLRQELRRDIQRRRRALTSYQRRQAARRALHHFLSLVTLKRGMHLAVYLPVRGELDTRPLINLALRLGCHVYVPIVRGERRALRFMPLTRTLRRNRYGIPEPLFLPHKTRSPRALDCVVMPLLGFGPHGERLGSGAGFYDQTFAFLRGRGPWRKPRLIGLAYHWQAMATLRSEAWDVPMSAVATDREVLRFTPGVELK